MSKHLVKIISICAMAILLPLIIVGVALCVTEPVACVLTIGQNQLDEGYSTSSIKIIVDNKEIDSTSVKLQKHTEVTVVFDSKDENNIDTYKFNGWYKGNADEIKDGDKVSEDEKYSFILRGNTTLTAVRKVREYNITYGGLLDDGTTSVASQIQETQQVLKYGESLEELAPVIDGSSFGGWYEVASQGESVDATGVKKAKFVNDNVELRPVWSNQMTIKYMKGDVQIAVARVAEEGVSSYVLLDANSTAVKNALTKGKEFAGWKDVEGKDVSSITYDLNGVVLYLQENAITYNFKVKYHAVAEDMIDLTYDVDNGFSVLDYENANYRPSYTFKGLEAGGTIYEKEGTDYVSAEGANLSDKIIAGEVNGIIVAVWECEYSSFHFNLGGFAEYKREGDLFATEWEIYGNKGGDKVEVAVFDLPAYFQDRDTEYCYDLMDNAYEVMLGGMTNLQTVEGNAVQFAGVIKVVDEDFQEYVLEDLNIKDLTFYQIITFLEFKIGSVANISEITVSFMFEIV